MRPLYNYYKYKRGYKFKQRTWYTRYHLGTDIICPKGTTVVAPFDGRAVYNPFLTGGKVIDFTTTIDGKKYVMRFMHLSQIVKTGPVSMGTIIAKTGNSGTLTTGAHLHLDISKNRVNIKNINNFVNPDTFNWSGETMNQKLKKCYAARDKARKNVQKQQKEKWALQKQVGMLKKKVAATEKKLEECREGKSILDKIKELIKGDGEK